MAWWLLRIAAVLWLVWGLVHIVAGVVTLQKIFAGDTAKAIQGITSIEDQLDDDIDGDGILNQREREVGTFPYKADSDGDSNDDLTEHNAETNPVDRPSM